ncbi:hypothetical protein KY362_02365 [Candidatus Woesearchaeota archaeon]|nr:hypothetical protein [Candidatus Woesearchaeota archaeon]
MKRGAFISIIGILLLLAAPGVFAVTNVGHIKLLAAYQEDGEFKGSPADLQLEIKEGNGRVFLETIPLSKVDTQISTRFAKEMACKFAEVDCSAYDFFYTIKSPAGIVGGPSAGGAIAALTVAQLLDLQVDQDAAMTGTINSGELIGPVGSLKEKLDAAKETGVKKALIPAVQTELKLSNNMTSSEYAEELGIEVVEVSTLSEAVEALTGTDFTEEEKDIVVPEVYEKVMEEVAASLCARTEELISEFDVFDLVGKTEIDFDLVQKQKEVMNLTRKGEEAFDEGKHYTAASYCFGANVKANQIIHQIKDEGEESRAEEAAAILEDIEEFDRLTEARKKETIADLQTYMIVKERILESKNYIVTGGNTTDMLGYAIERLNSAESWSEFFGTGQQTFNLDDKSLEGSCANVLMEVDERFQYLNLFFPGLLENLKNDLLMSHKYYEDEEYALCIYLASRTKAEANIMVTMLGVKEEVVDDLLQLKLEAAKRAITKQADNNIFPIIAYSYYEYASSLAEDNEYSEIIYAEYALELSDIDIYFEKTSAPGIELGGVKDTVKEYIPTILFIWGLILGFIFCWVVLRGRSKEKKGVSKQKRKPAPKKAVRKKSAPKQRGKTGIKLR